MTYRSPMTPFVAELRWSGTPTQTNFTYTLNILQQTTPNLLSITNGTDLNLPTGHYYCAAYPDFTRSGTGQTNQVHWFLGGVQIGKTGGSDHYNSESTDIAEAAFTLHTNSILTLRQTAQANGTISLTNDAIAYIWRVSR
jgi:hypothetical protein